jgi:hypothetical protein
MPPSRCSRLLSRCDAAIEVSRLLLTCREREGEGEDAGEVGGREEEVGGGEREGEGGEGEGEGEDVREVGQGEEGGKGEVGRGAKEVGGRRRGRSKEKE